MRERILITGPGGRVGPHIVPLLRKEFALRLFDAKPLPREADDEVVRGDIQDFQKLRAACDGVDAMIHLAAISDEADFQTKLLPVNLEGLYNAFEAAKQAGLKNVTLAGELLYHADKALLDLRNNRLTVHELTVPVEGNVSTLSTAPRLNLQLKGDNLEAGQVFQILGVFGLAPRDTEVSGPMNVQMSLTGPATQLLTQVRGLFKDIKVNGKRAFKGTLRGEVAIRLPAGGGPASRRMQGNGKLTARDGELTNIDLIRKIERVTGMIGLSKEERR